MMISLAVWRFNCSSDQGIFRIQRHDYKVDILGASFEPSVIGTWSVGRCSIVSIGKYLTICITTYKVHRCQPQARRLGPSARVAKGDREAQTLASAGVPTFM